MGSWNISAITADDIYAIPSISKESERRARQLAVDLASFFYEYLSRPERLLDLKRNRENKNVFNYSIEKYASDFIQDYYRKEKKWDDLKSLNETGIEDDGEVGDPLIDHLPDGRAPPLDEDIVADFLLSGIEGKVRTEINSWPVHDKVKARLHDRLTIMLEEPSDDDMKLGGRDWKGWVEQRLAELGHGDNKKFDRKILRDIFVKMGYNQFLKRVLDDE